MQWYLVFVFLFLYILLVPVNLAATINFDLLHLKGELMLKASVFKPISIKIKVKKGYIYLTVKNKTQKEKLSMKNPHITFVYDLIRMLYFRQVIKELTVDGNIGYVNNAFAGAMLANFNDILIKCIVAPVKNNKKSAHIFVNIIPNYNNDIYTLKLFNEISLSVFDVLYSLAIAKFKRK